MNLNSSPELSSLPRSSSFNQTMPQPTLSSNSLPSLASGSQASGSQSLDPLVSSRTQSSLIAADSANSLDLRVMDPDLIDEKLERVLQSLIEERVENLNKADEKLEQAVQILIQEKFVNLYEDSIGSTAKRAKNPDREHEIMGIFKLDGIRNLLGDIQKLRRGSRFKRRPLVTDFTQERAITANAKSKGLSLAVHTVFNLIHLSQNHTVDQLQREIINFATVQSHPLLKKFFHDVKLGMDSFSIDRLRMFAEKNEEMLNIIDRLESQFEDAKLYYHEMTGEELIPSPQKAALMGIQTESLKEYFDLRSEWIAKQDGSIQELKELNDKILASINILIDKLEKNEDLQGVSPVVFDDSKTSVQPKKVFTNHPDGILKDLKNELPFDPVNGATQSINFLDELRNGIYALQNLLEPGEECAIWHGSDLDRTFRDIVATLVVRLHLAVEFSVDTDNQPLLDKLKELVPPLSKTISILTANYEKGMGQLALINSSESEKLIVGYRQHLDNLGELNQCLCSFLDQPKVGQLVKLRDEGSSQNDLLAQLDGDLSGVSSNPQEDYNSLLAVWMDDFENVLKPYPSIKDKLVAIKSQGRVPASQLLDVMNRAFPDIFRADDTKKALQDFYNKLNDPDNLLFRTQMRAKLNTYLENPNTLEDTHMVDAFKVFKLLNDKNYFQDVILADFESEKECMAALILNKILDVKDMRIRLLFENLHDVKNAQDILEKLKDSLGFVDFKQLSEHITIMFANSDTSLRAGMIGLLHTAIVAKQLKRLGFNIEFGQGSAPERGLSDWPMVDKPDLITVQPGNATKLVLRKKLSGENLIAFQIRMLKTNRDTIMKNLLDDLEKPLQKTLVLDVHNNLLRLLNGILTLDEAGPTVG